MSNGMQTGRPTSRLAAASAAAKQPTAAPTQTQQTGFQRAIAGARPFVPYTIPRLGLAVAVTLCPSNEQERVEGEVFEAMRARKLELTTSTENTYELRRAKLILALVVVDPTSHEPIGSIEDWDQLDEDVIAECWRFQLSVRAAYDPVSVELKPAVIQAIADAIKKKDATLLRLFGSSALASYLLATDVQASNSATPTSLPSESSPGS